MFAEGALTLLILLGSATAAIADGSEWGAIAAGVTFDAATRSGSSTFSIRFRGTKEEAERTALAACQAGSAKQIPQPTCTLYTVWNHGCEYAVIGEQWPPGRGVASIGVGSNSKDAQIALYSNISNASGLYLHPAKGGCLR
jgi:hypothetical protein